jgi:hypothetical protein
VVLRVPSASTWIFLRVVDTDTYQQSASMCVYRATQDGSWGLTFVMYFNHDIQVLSRWRNSRIVCRSLVWLFQCTKYLGYSTLISKNPTPDGSNDASWSFSHLLLCSIQDGCAPSAPDGSSPRGYNRKSLISSIGSNILCLLLIIRSKLYMIISSGACLALPMVVAPEAIVKYFWV